MVNESTHIHHLSNCVTGDWNHIVVLGDGPVEVVNVSNDGKTCAPLPDYPIDTEGLAATYYQEKIVACPGYGGDGNCYELESGALSWKKVLPYPSTGVEYHRASVVDNEIVFSGGAGNGRKVFYYDDQSIFQPGPELPVDMFDHCQLTINDTHAFIGGFPKPTAVILNSRTQQYTSLPDIPVDLPPAACGLLNGSNGEEILIASTTYSFILNLDDLVWRNGPKLPKSLSDMAYAQVSGGFLAIGGYDRDSILGGSYRSSIYKFNEHTYEWNLLPQGLARGREEAFAVAVPEDFLDCQ